MESEFNLREEMELQHRKTEAKQRKYKQNDYSNPGYRKPNYFQNDRESYSGEMKRKFGLENVEKVVKRTSLKNH